MGASSTVVQHAQQAQPQQSTGRVHARSSPARLQRSAKEPARCRAHRAIQPTPLLALSTVPKVWVVIGTGRRVRDGDRFLRCSRCQRHARSTAAVPVLRGTSRQAYRQLQCAATRRYPGPGLVQRARTIGAACQTLTSGGWASRKKRGKGAKGETLPTKPGNGVGA
jgi:hypothetical protein